MLHCRAAVVCLGEQLQEHEVRPRTHRVDKTATEGKVRLQRLTGEQGRETRGIGGRIPDLKVTIVSQPRKFIGFI